MLTVTKDITKQNLEENEMLLDFVMFKFIQISENIKRISDELKNINKNIPWNLIIGLRNKIVYQYGIIDLTTIYEVLKSDLKVLFNNLKKIVL